MASTNGAQILFLMHNLITTVETNYRWDDTQTIVCPSADGIRTILSSNFCMATFKSQSSNRIDYDSNDLIPLLQSHAHGQLALHSIPYLLQLHPRV